MTTQPPKDKHRQRDNNVKTPSSHEAASTFADALTTDTSKGAVTRAAQKAYPNQSKAAAQVTGSRLLRNPIVQGMIAERRRRATMTANVTRQEVIGLLTQQAFASLADVLNMAGTDLDLKRARDLGLDHLVKEITVTERHHTRRSPVGKGKYRTETHRRVTTRYKIHDPQKAMDLLAEIAGWKKERGKNPIDSARETYLIMRQSERYKDVPDEELARFPAERFNVSVNEILEGQS